VQKHLYFFACVARKQTGRKLVGIGIAVAVAVAVEITQDIHIEKINGLFLFELKGLPAKYKASDRRRRIRSYFGPLVSRSTPRKADPLTILSVIRC
jgi:hypothetical protein